MAHLTPREFGEAFDRLFKRSAFRLELLDKYIAANEAAPYERFLDGLPQDPAWREPWARFVRSSLREGKKMARVHVLSEPLSDYLQFELTCAYPANVAAGEEIGIFPLAEYPVLTYPRRDFWLFDDAVAAVMDYGDDGGFLGADTTSAPAEIARYRHVRDFLMQKSVPLAGYLESRRMKEAV